MSDLYGLKLSSRAGEILVVNEVTHTFGSADNLHAYPDEVDLSQDGYRASAHGVWLDGNPVAVFSSSGGATGVHPYSALVLDDRIYLAVSNHVVCFSPAPFAVEWSTEVDMVTCFGLHFSEEREALISHGELEIVRLSKTGEIVWSQGGADIFTGDFALEPEFIEARDFNDRAYRLAYADGAQVGS